ncbi:DUF6247 family protein [Nonomuraea gerenzanensis]|uniref:Uncharacterized protein n=1 Tax=Nonomuraea gerenzanensis TaxID=93944 RepID=A0A1M4EI46_9ACTN|nr:DUF6247 family protein [Nonomuraea gerenzanensis]UBU09980.1 DUF6247 family protein [Nonomuraea gerenzanensis]SBO98434.1 hypothetical protein BN4615_P7950 [Nonomuraea gerenzanensis]
MLFDCAYWHTVDKARITYDLTPINECVAYWWWQAVRRRTQKPTRAPFSRQRAMST